MIFGGEHAGLHSSSMASLAREGRQRTNLHVTNASKGPAVNQLTKKAFAACRHAGPTGHPPSNWSGPG